jgi:putative ABC transport system permease protein
MVLAFGGSWALVRYVFEGHFAPDYVAALAIAALMVAITVAIGLLTAREVYRETPVTALRET